MDRVLARICNSHGSFRVMVLIAMTGCCTAWFVAGCGNDSPGVPHGWDFGDNDPHTILCYGDSLTALVFPRNGGPTYPQHLAEIVAMDGRSVKAMGTSGQRGTDAMQGINALLAFHRPGVLLIMFGYNDFAAGIPPDNVAAALIHMADTARARGTFPIIALLPLCGPAMAYINSSIEQLNMLLQAHTANRYVLADVAGVINGRQTELLPDDVHFSSEAARWVAFAFADVL